MKINLQYSLASGTKPIFLSGFIILFAISSAISQAPAIEWENTIGGSSDEYALAVVQTADDGYVIGGRSASNISGDKTDNSEGLVDYWIVKLNSVGSIVWQNTIGGSSDDHIYSIVETIDGGCVAIGFSRSNVSGDKTENNMGTSTSYDYWVVKLSAVGEIEWQNTIGGEIEDTGLDIDQTDDGGYIIGGHSKSNISGDKSENCKGYYDNWIVKLNPLGEIEWQNTIGGSNDDYFCSVEQTIDGGYIVGGYSRSNISFDKTENCIGAMDYWVLKLDSLGEIEWQNTIGGSGDDILQAIVQADNGDYLLCGYSASNISGDKTENCIGAIDYWVVRLSPLGEIEWQNTIGGSNADVARAIGNTSDGGCIIGGSSLSNISGDKTENQYGTSGDYWIIKLDSIGVIEWDNTIGGSGTDEPTSLSQTADGGYILAGYSNSNISGDKTENTNGLYDIWIVKIESPACIPTEEVCNALDDDCDGLIDEGTSPTISIAAGGPTTFCTGGNVVLTATHTGAGLQWKKNGTMIAGATGLTYTATTKGSYTCESNNACGLTLSAPISVTVNKNPTANIIAGGPTTFCAGGSVVLTANAGGGLSYQWYKGATAIPGATTISYTATTSGSYKCRVTKNATGCFKNSNTIVVSIVCREGETPVQTLEAYPNPATTELYITCTADINTAQLYNDLGQLIMEISVSDGYAQADISALAAGMYILRAGGEVVQWVKQ